MIRNERKRKRRKQNKSVPYDYSEAFNQSLDELNDIFRYEVTQTVQKKENLE